MYLKMEERVPPPPYLATKPHGVLFQKAFKLIVKILTVVLKLLFVFGLFGSAQIEEEIAGWSLAST